MPRLPRTDQAIGMLRGGRSARIIARSFAVHHSTFVRITERYHITGSSNDGARSARPRVLTAGQDRANRLTHLRDRFRTATQTAAETTGTHHRPVSARTVRNGLRAEGATIRPYWPCVGSVLTQSHRQAVSLGAVLVNAGLCSDGLRLPSVTRRSFCDPRQMAEKEFIGDITSSTRMPVYAKWTGVWSKRHGLGYNIGESSLRFAVR